MQEDPIMLLLKKHFQKVNQCLENEKNFDILTRFSFKSLTCKMNDTLKIQNGDVYTNPEMEFAQKVPESNLVGNKMIFPTTALKDNDSEVIQKEIDLEMEDSTSSNKSSVSDLMEAKIYENPLRDENFQFSEENFRNSFNNKPETPILSMLDTDEENIEIDSPFPQKIARSHKFIHTVQPFLESDENHPKEYNAFNEEGLVPRIDSIATKSKKSILDLDEGIFEQELEEYKKDIKLEKAIKSLSVDGLVPRQHTPPKSNTQSSSYQSYFRELNNPRKNLLNELQPEYEIDLRTEATLMKEPNTPDYLKSFFTNSSTNICRRDSKHCSYSFDSSQQNIPELGRTDVDEEMQDFVFEKIFKNESNDSSSRISTVAKKIENTTAVNSRPPADTMNFGTKNYILMNHFEIQKEMAKRIEDMFKSGDGD
ncbi:hypothetical protein HHI36_003136 [Cryptolaemus montrouzieri]|uniref:Uncharacterized protein n=1 Tax=Cryptolaemus montrouzieri TaxID=559131 RepID=A0ABD2PD17_9CUCU